MYCENCGRQIRDSVKACRFCGKETTVALKAKKARLFKTLLIVVLAIVVIGAGFLIIRGFTGTDTVSGVVENGSVAGQMIRAGKTTYMVLENNDRKITQILKVDEKADAKAQEVYRISWPEGGNTAVSLVCIQGNTLYYLEHNTYKTSVPHLSLYELKSLDLKKEGSNPTAIKLKTRDGKQIPESIIDFCEKTRNREFSLEDLLGFQRGFEKNYIYIMQAYERAYSKAVLFQIDCTTGEVSFVEGRSLDPVESWVLRAIKDGYLYYERLDYEVSEGLYRASLSDLKEERLLDASGMNYYFADIRIMDNSLIYMLSTNYPEQTGFELHYLDLKTKEDSFIFAIETRKTFDYTLSATTIYYFEQGELRSCNHDGSDDRLLIKNRDSAGVKDSLHILGDWIYYRQNGDWYRVRPGDGEFPTKSLN